VDQGPLRPNCCRCCASWASASSLLAARPRLPHRRDPLARAALRRRLAQDQPALHRRELQAQPAHRRRGSGRCLRGGCDTGADRSGLAARARRRHRPDSRHQAGRPRRGAWGSAPLTSALIQDLQSDSGFGPVRVAAGEKGVDPSTPDAHRLCGRRPNAHRQVEIAVRPRGLRRGCRRDRS
jgi:hypothetical protein